MSTSDEINPVVPMSTTNDIIPEPYYRTCKKGCTQPYLSSENYHNRMHHQETVTVKLTDDKQIIINRNPEGLFSCDICRTFLSRDPERLRSHYTSCTPPADKHILPNISDGEYLRIPDKYTVTSVPGYNLLSFNVVVNSLLKAIICIHCQHIILPPSLLPHHVHSHLSDINVPTELVDHLIKEYRLEENVRYPSKIIDPIYGIPILEHSQFFCNSCNRGYYTLEILRSHQSRSQCTGYSPGYGQLIPGHKRRIIQVRLDSLNKKEEVNVDYISLFKQASTTRHDYSKIPITVAENESNLTAFFRQDGWLSHVEGNTPADLYEARRTHEKDDILGEGLRQASRRYLGQIQSQIEQNVHYGLLKNIATTNV
jgi:hypothetical protein